MADKEVHHVSNGGASTGLLAGIVIAALAIFGLLFAFGAFDFRDGKDVNVSVDTPNMQLPDKDVDVPSAPNTGG